MNTAPLSPPTVYTPGLRLTTPTPPMVEGKVHLSPFSTGDSESDDATTDAQGPTFHQRLNITAHRTTAACPIPKKPHAQLKKTRKVVVAKLHSKVVAVATPLPSKSAAPPSRAPEMARLVPPASPALFPPAPSPAAAAAPAPAPGSAVVAVPVKSRPPPANAALLAPIIEGFVQSEIEGATSAQLSSLARELRAVHQALERAMSDFQVEEEMWRAVEKAEEAMTMRPSHEWAGEAADEEDDELDEHAAAYHPPRKCGSKGSGKWEVARQASGYTSDPDDSRYASTVASARDAASHVEAASILSQLFAAA